MTTPIGVSTLLLVILNYMSILTTGTPIIPMITNSIFTYYFTFSMFVWVFVLNLG